MLLDTKLNPCHPLPIIPKVSYKKYNPETKCYDYEYIGYYVFHQKTAKCFSEEITDDDFEHLLITDGFGDWGMPQPFKVMKIEPDGGELELIAPSGHSLGEMSDNYHTFDELYEHRTVLFSVICNQNKSISWKSKKHEDNTMYDQMFIAGINTPKGQAAYHIENEYWDWFKVKELDTAPHYDGYTPQESLERLKSLSDWK